MTAREYYQFAKERLFESCPPEQKNADTAAFEAQTLLSHFLSLSREQLLARFDETLTTDAEKALQNALSEKCGGRPLQYILGEWEFYGKRIFCGEGCLIPRPETEFLVDYALSYLPRGGRFLDLCTGSGCIPTAILSARDDLSAQALDLSKEALAYAEKNRAFHRLDARLTLICADLRHYRTDERFDAILSNPPYIKSDDMSSLSREVLREPSIALDGGKDGLCFYRAILQNYAHCLAPQGFFAFETGYDTADGVAALLTENGFTAEIRYDYASLPRIVVGKKKDSV